MKLSDIKLPSNKKFGYFFSFIFFVLAGYFFFNESWTWFFIFLFLTIALLTISVLNPKLLLPLNKIWMIFGYLLGLIIRPIVLGIIFFGIITPIAFLLRLIGRDELRLRIKNKSSWISRSTSIKPESFKLQF